MPISERAVQGFAQRFVPEACSVSLCAPSKAECLRELGELLARSRQLETASLPALQAEFLAREKIASTGVGAGVAIPHVKLAGQREVALACAVHRAGVAWAAVDGEPAHLFFAVVRPAGASERHDPARHLELLQWIAHLSRDKDFRRFALVARTPQELSELLLEAASA